MTAATWILIYKKPQDPVATAEPLKFFAWSYTKGGKMAEELDYVPMPATVVADIQKMWASRHQGRERQAPLHPLRAASRQEEAPVGASSSCLDGTSPLVAAASRPLQWPGCSELREGPRCSLSGAMTWSMWR